MLRKIFEYLTTIGIGSGISERESKRIRITNTLAVLCMGYLCMRSIPYFFVHSSYGVIMITAAAFFGIIPMLNYFKHFTSAKYALIILSNTYIFGLSYAYLGGVKSGVQGLILIGVMFPLMLFDISKRKHIYAGLLVSFINLAGVFLIEIYNPQESIFSGNLFLITMIGIATLGALVAFFSGYFFYSINEISERKLRKINDKYRDKVDEIVADRILLRHKNRMIQTDIQMATKIQKRLLPSKSPGDHISFYYQPMHDLGGDFLSFSQLPDGRTSFLISDVSGHGVTAAFITLMVKNTLEHEKNTLDQPDVTLTKLNEALFQQANNHFVTAICGVFDPENQKMLIACAGHVPPYLLHKGVSKKLILPSSGIPLGILPESKMDSGKKYKTYEYNFQKNDLVVFYTDGLSESRPVGNYESEDYETARMIPAMESMARLSPQQFMNELMQDARNYRNSPHFDDDICAMIWQV